MTRIRLDRVRFDPLPSSGRLANGQFAPGNRLGKATGTKVGNRMRKHREDIVGAVSDEDMRRIISSMVAKAKRGDLAAARLVLAYVVGPPESLDLLESVAQIESRLEQLEQ